MDRFVYLPDFGGNGFVLYTCYTLPFTVSVIINQIGGNLAGKIILILWPKFDPARSGSCELQKSVHHQHGEALICRLSLQMSAFPCQQHTSCPP